MDWDLNNAEERSQSVGQDVVDAFAAAHRVSASLWDTITGTRVAEYVEGDVKDGYVLADEPSPPIRSSVRRSTPMSASSMGSGIRSAGPMTRTVSS